MGHSKHSPEMEALSYTGLPKKDRNISNKQHKPLPPCLQELEEQQQRQPRAIRRKDITKNRAELNDIETISTILRIKESRS